MTDRAEATIIELAQVIAAQAERLELLQVRYEVQFDELSRAKSERDVWRERAGDADTHVNEIKRLKDLVGRYEHVIGSAARVVNNMHGDSVDALRKALDYAGVQYD